MIDVDCRDHRLAETAAALRTGRLDLLEYLDELLAGIADIDTLLGALLPEAGVRERLRQEAGALLAAFPEPASRPALFGVPVAIKDLIRVDGFDTRAGSALPPEVFAGAEATCVTRLRAAGALILGKSTTDEFAYADPPATRNPRALAHTPGGSSAGSAAAVAAGLCPLALGTQTTRSIVAPASFCGAVGFKPSHGRIPLDGVVLLAPFFDVVGTLTQDVAGARLAASSLLDDWAPAVAVGRPLIGVPRQLHDALDELYPEARWREPLRATTARLRAAGYRILDVELGWDDQLRAVFDSAMAVLHGEMLIEHRERFAAHGALYRPTSRRGIERGQEAGPEALAAARTHGRELRAAFNTWMDRVGVDLLLCPSQILPAPRLGTVTGYGATTTPWSFVGAPCLSLPVCSVDGLPMGMQLIARLGADEQLLHWAEQVFAAAA